MVTRSSRLHLKRSTTATGVVVLAVITTLLGLVTDESASTIVGLSLITVVAVDAMAAWLTVAPVDISLHGPPGAITGQPSEWVLTARGLRRPVIVSPATIPRNPRFLIHTAAPAIITFPSLPRGLIHHVGLDVVGTGPLGLYQAGRRLVIPLTVPLAVAPAPIAVDLEWPRPRAMNSGLTTGSPLGDDLFRSLRPYRRGDLPRHVHWGATAHHGHLMVHEHDGTGVIGLRIMVDPGLPGDMADHVTGVASAVATEALARGWVVQMVTADGERHRPDPPTPHSPFGAPLPTEAYQPGSAVTRADMVSGIRAVNHQLATATQGVLTVRGWAGLTCHVTPRGVAWG